jgi:hypothetical protein
VWRPKERIRIGKKRTRRIDNADELLEERYKSGLTKVIEVERYGAE